MLQNSRQILENERVNKERLWPGTNKIKDIIDILAVSIAIVWVEYINQRIPQPTEVAVKLNVYWCLSRSSMDIF